MDEPAQTPLKRTRYDPIVKARREGNLVTRAWLQDGERMTPLQRVGHILVSLMYLSFGIYFASIWWETLAARDLYYLVTWGTLSAGTTALGMMGMKNAFKFRKHE